MEKMAEAAVHSNLETRDSSGQEAGSSSESDSELRGRVITKKPQGTKRKDEETVVLSDENSRSPLSHSSKRSRPNESSSVGKNSAGRTQPRPKTSGNSEGEKNKPGRQNSILPVGSGHTGPSSSKAELVQPSSPLSTGKPGHIRNLMFPSGSVNGLQVARSSQNHALFKEPDQQFITKRDFDAFKNVLFAKLNGIEERVIIIQGNNLQLRVFARPELDGLCLPANDLDTLEALNNKLADETTRSKLATHLADVKGGNSMKDFLRRALSFIMTNELCYMTNWTGSKFPVGAKNLDGTPLTRTYKKKFKKLTNIHKLLQESANLIENLQPSPTEAGVINYIKTWLLAYNDRMNPRPHRVSVVREPSPEPGTPRRIRPPRQLTPARAGSPRVRTTPRSTPRSAPRSSPRSSPRSTPRAGNASSASSSLTPNRPEVREKALELRQY